MLKRPVLVIVSCLFLLSPTVAAQMDGSTDAQVKCTVFGDLRIEGGADPSLPQAFLLILRDLYGNLFGRQMVSNGGRYRFLDIPNGEYDLIVLVENREVTRIHFLLAESRNTDVRKDLELEWQGVPEETRPAGESYARTSTAGREFQDAQELLKKGNFKKAVTVLQKLVNEDAEDYEAWTELGTAHFRNGKVKDALAAYLKATEVRPSYFPAWINLGKAQLESKQYEAAAEALDKSIQMNQEAAEAHYLLGECYLQLRKGSQAVVHFNEALRLEPVAMADAHLRLGTLYRAAGYADRAVGEFEKYLEKRPEAKNRKEIEAYILQNRKP